jgi:hypothetical protein
MSTDDPDDDEDWYDDDDELDEEEAARCPECGGPVEIVTDKCPACGYWLSEADRRAMWFGTSKPMWLKVTAAIVLVAFLTSLLGLVIF